MNMHKERLWYLERFNLLAAMKPDEMAMFNREVKDTKYKRGETIYLPGDQSDAVYFVKKGRVKLSSRDRSGKSVTIRVCDPGEPFGEMAAVGEEVRPLEATALDDVWLCWVGKERFARFAEAHPQIALRLAKVIGLHRQELENRLKDLLFLDVPTRLARTLLKLADKYGRENDDKIQIQIRITHRELAELIGATRETTTAALNRLQRERIVTRRLGKLLITAPQRLRELAEG